MLAVQNPTTCKIVLYPSSLPHVNCFPIYNFESIQSLSNIEQPIIINTKPLNMISTAPQIIAKQNVMGNKESYQKVLLKQMNKCQNKISKNKSKETKKQRKKFTPEEDERLKELVDNMGLKKWEAIAKEMPGRTGRQCRDRYKNYLVPGFFNGQWSREEDELLFEKYIEYGSQWSKIMQFFTNRSSNALKNRWNYFVSRNFKFDSNYDAVNNIKIFDNKSNINTINNYEKEKDDEIDPNTESVIYEEIFNYSNAANSYIDPFDIYANEDINQTEDIIKNDDIFSLNIE